MHTIEQGIDTAEGRAMFGMLSVLAELQRGLIVANTMDGLVSACVRGRVGWASAEGHRRPGRARPAALRHAVEDRPARLPTCLACLAPQRTATSTRPRLCRGSPRRLRSQGSDLYSAPGPEIGVRGRLRAGPWTLTPTSCSCRRRS
ncbi:recombinase family protein [Streptomyces sp. NBC_00233]|nr:recombinase family protein [Streptomyces sp. NBC_00233]